MKLDFRFSLNIFTDEWIISLILTYLDWKIDLLAFAPEMEAI